jgi:serine/threonine protein kinase
LHFVHSYPVDFLPTTTSAPLLLPRAHVRASTSISPLTSELSSIYLSHQGSPRPQRSSSSDLRPCLACASLVSSKNYRTRRHINMDSEDEIPFQILREITDGFSKERKLGQGAFGVVYKGVTKNGDDVAVKRLLINSSLDFKHQLKNELYNLRKLNHPNIVHVLGYCFETEQKPFIMEDGSKVFVDETQGALCLEYMHNGSLQRLLSDEFSGLEWHTRFKIIKGTCEGLKYIHELEEPIYHLDLKPDNILLDKDMVPKIADFGLSRIIHNKEPTRITQNPYGTQGYQPREYIDSGEISGKFDIFSLGVIMIRVVSGPKGYPKCLDMSLDEFVDQVRNDISY